MKARMPAGFGQHAVPGALGRRARRGQAAVDLGADGDKGMAAVLHGIQQGGADVVAAGIFTGDAQQTGADEDFHENHRLSVNCAVKPV